LVVWGRNDPLASAENGLMLFRLLLQGRSDVRWSLINRAGHFVFREQPTAFNRAVATFIAQVSQATKPTIR
jgi:pimeloyl-ACP methyl ester carboxylesterase